jgi:Ca2+-binding RTX toxin-like protein
MAVTAVFSPDTGVLIVLGDALDNAITVSRNPAGDILINDGAVAISGGTATVGNTTQIQVFGQDGNDTILLDEASGALPAGFVLSGFDSDKVTGGSGADQLFGQEGNDTLLGKGGNDNLAGGDGDDTLTGGDADDQVFGEAGNDRMIWNPGDDSDKLEGGDGIDTAEVNGGNGAEVFTVTANGARVRFDRLDPAPFSLDIGTTEKLVVNMNGSDDSFSATGNLAALIGITVDGGLGNDTIRGSNGIDFLLGGDGNDFIDGQQGNDVAFLGAGDDTFQWDPGDGSDTVEGQDGADTLLFNGSASNEVFALSANGPRARLTRDLGSIVMDVDGVETVNLKALDGIDKITVNDLAGTDVAQVGVDLAATLGGTAGDAKADTVIVDGSTGADVINVVGAATSVSVLGLAAQVAITNSEGANDTLVINGLGGADGITATTLPAGVIKLAIDGGAGDDTILGSQGADRLLGGDGADFALGDNGDDTALLGAGDDVFEWHPGDGNDTVEGQDGSDLMLFFGSNINENVDIEANGGRVRFTRDVASITMDLDSVERIELRALGGNDNIVVGDLNGTDTTRVDVDLRGPAGGGDGAVDTVTVNGTQGDDAFGAAGDAGGVNVFGLHAAVDLFFAEAANDRLVLNALGGNDIINATSLQADGIQLTINGGLGADVILGSAGVDTINGGAGNDDLSGGEGTEETVHGDDGNDTLHSGGEGHYFGDAGNDLVFAGLTGLVNEVLDGGDGIDTLDTTSFNDAYAIDLATGVTNFGESFTNFESIITADGNDTVAGTAAANAITTNAGNDTLDGRAGADSMKGGQGDDHYVVDNAGDLVTELAGAGIDSVSSSVSYVLTSNVENLTLIGAAVVGTGNTLANILNGNAGSNTLDGKTGADTMTGGAGNDTYRVDSAGDIVIEVTDGGTDRVLASISYALAPGQQVEALATVDASAVTAMNLTGNEIANMLIGNAGNNILDGLGGADRMTGGLGNDTYVVDNAADFITELAGQGTDIERASVSDVLANNIETLILTGAANINGTGNGLVNTLLGNAGDNTLDGKAGADAMRAARATTPMWSLSPHPQLAGDGVDTLDGREVSACFRGGGPFLITGLWEGTRCSGRLSPCRKADPMR